MPIYWLSRPGARLQVVGDASFRRRTLYTMSLLLPAPTLYKPSLSLIGLLLCQYDPDATVH